MARKRVRRLKGKKFGNALGGYKKQKRDAKGRFASGGGSSAKKRARAAKKYKKRDAKAHAREMKTWNKERKKATKAEAKVKAKNRKTEQRRKAEKQNPFLKRSSTSLKNPANRSQQQFRTGALSRQAGMVPYTRHSFSSQSAGFNAGLRILPNYRLSGGAYIKIQNIDKTRREKYLREKDEQIVLGLASKVSPHEKLDGIAAGFIKKVRRNQIDKLVGGEMQVGQKSYARMTTDQNAMPTVTVEYNRGAGRAKRKMKGRNARREALWEYNDMVTKNRSAGTKVSTPRPPRRGR